MKWFVWGTERWDRKELAREAMVIEADSQAKAKAIFAVKYVGNEFYSVCAVPLSNFEVGYVLEFI